MQSTTPGHYRPLNNTLEVIPGQLGMVLAVLPTTSLQPANLGQPHKCTDVMVLVRLDGSTGPIIQVPVVTRGVLVTGATGIVYEVDVSFLPLRGGWATTVQATQGLEFPRVLLDLNRAGWLPGGGYSGIGRVRGDLRTGLRILGGFDGSRDVFAAEQEVLDWYQRRVLPAL